MGFKQKTVPHVSNNAWLECELCRRVFLSPIWYDCQALDGTHWQKKNCLDFVSNLLHPSFSPGTAAGKKTQQHLFFSWLL